MPQPHTGPHVGKKKDHHLQMNTKIEIIMHKKKTAYKLSKGKLCFNSNVDAYFVST